MMNNINKRLAVIFMVLNVVFTLAAQSERFCIAKDGKTTNILVEQLVINPDNNRYSYLGNNYNWNNIR